MRAKGVKSVNGNVFHLVSMAMVIVVTMATGVKGNEAPGQNQNQSSNWTKLEISLNETGGNLTLDFNSGDLAFEREESKHQLIITGDPDSPSSWKRFVECRGKNIKSMSASSCDTMESCEEKKSSLFDQRICKFGLSWLAQCGWDCTGDGDESLHQYGSSYSSYDDDNENDKDYYADPDESVLGPSCFRVKITDYSYGAGIVQCTSEENGVNVTTFDHYTIGYSYARFLSSFKNKSVSDLIKTELYVSSLTEDLNANSSYSQNDKNVTLFVDEEVTLLECQVPELLFHKRLIIRAHREDGSTVHLDSKMSSMYHDGFLKADLTSYRVPADLIAFSCSAQRSNSSGEWLENRINLTVQGLPSKVIIKSLESNNGTVDLTSGAKVNLHCGLTGPLPVKTSIRNQMRKIRDNLLKETSSKSVIEFLRFHQVAGEHLICEDLDLNTANENSTGETEHEKQSGNAQSFPHFFNLAPSAPKIHNPNSASSSVHLIYHEDHVVDQTLLCRFNGEPKPVITWIKNGHNFWSTKSMGILEQRNEALEHVKLRLDSTTIQPTDFENGHVNFSCVATNYFGSDRLDFIVLMDGKYEHHSENSESTTTTTTEKSTTSTTLTSSTTKILTSTSTFQPKKQEHSHSNLHPNSTLNLDQLGAAEKSKLIAIVTTFFLLSFIFILGVSILWKKRAAVCRAVESRRIFTFRNLLESDRNRSESMRNVLAD